MSLLSAAHPIIEETRATHVQCIHMYQHRLFLFFLYACLLQSTLGGGYTVDATIHNKRNTTSIYDKHISDKSMYIRRILVLLYTLLSPETHRQQQPHKFRCCSYDRPQTGAQTTDPSHLPPRVRPALLFIADSRLTYPSLGLAGICRERGGGGSVSSALGDGSRGEVGAAVEASGDGVGRPGRVGGVRELEGLRAREVVLWESKNKDKKSALIVVRKKTRVVCSTTGRLEATSHMLPYVVLVRTCTTRTLELKVCKNNGSGRFKDR